MRNAAKPDATPAAPEKVALYDIGEDEAGMRLDRWFRRRFPDLAQSHLMKIVRKGEVRVSGKRADVSTRLEPGRRSECRRSVSRPRPRGAKGRSIRATPRRSGR